MTAPTQASPKPGVRRKAVVLGGAGFVGSAIVTALVDRGWTVHVVDSLEADTFSDVRRLSTVRGGIVFENRDIGSLRDTPGIVRDCDLIVDSVGWTRHSDAEHNPARDLSLNLGAHFGVLDCLDPLGPLYVLLGSLHQFAGATGSVDDDAPFAPRDVQGIHKCALELHARRVAARARARVVVLRVGNCMGPGQPVGSGDVGLVGSFIYRVLAGETLEIFAGPRRRNLCFTPDIGALVAKLAEQDVAGFVAMNVPGLSVEIAEFAEQLVRAAGRGSVRVVPMPAEFAQRDVQSPVFTGRELARRVPRFVPAPLSNMISQTLGNLLPDEPR